VLPTFPIMDKIHDVFGVTSSMSTQMVRIDAEGNKEKNSRTSKIIRVICVICVLPSAVRRLPPALCSLLWVTAGPR